jgi:hypothetical protein
LRLRSAIRHNSNHAFRRTLSLNGTFSLTTANGIRYILKGDHDALLSYNGKQVQVTGTMKATKKTPPSLRPFALPRPRSSPTSANRKPDH